MKLTTHYSVYSIPESYKELVVQCISSSMQKKPSIIAKRMFDKPFILS